LKSAADLTDYEMITQILNGNKDLFAELVRRYKNLVYSVVVRMVASRDEADDLAQEVFIKVYRNLDKYYPDYKVSTWIIRITTNHVIDYRRKNRLETQAIEDMEYEEVHWSGPETSPEAEFLKKELKEMLDNLVSSLPDMYRVPIMLYHEQGLSYQEIADIIEQPLSKVKNRIFRGRKMLKESIMRMKEGPSYVMQ